MRGLAGPARGAMALVAILILAGAGGSGAQEPDASDSPAAEAPAAAPPAARPLQTTSQASALAESQAQAAAQPPAAAPAPTARLAPGTPIPPAELEALVDGAVRQAMADDHVPGVAVSVVQSGQPVLKKGYGFAAMAPARPVDPDATLFRVGSISKLFTWMTVMKEVEHGRMRLDGSVNLYLPEPLQVRDQGYARPVELRDLMTHSAGFEDKALGRLFERDPGAVRPLAKYLRQEKPRRVRPAGTLPEYSNYGAALAGAAAAQVTGKPYEDLVEAEIIRPLGLAHTSFREPYPADAGLPAPLSPGLAAQMAQGLRWTGAGYEPQPFEYTSQLAPAGSASSTAGDMARFMQLILAGGALDGIAVYGPQTAQAFRTVTLRSGPGIDGWASGFMQRRLPGGFDGFGHEGGTLNFRANLVTVPALNLGIFIAGDSAGAQALVEHLPSLIVTRFYAAAAAAPTSGAPELAAGRRAYAGTYIPENRRYGGLEQFVSLLSGEVHVGVSRDGRLVVMDREAGDAFAPGDGPATFREIGTGRTAGFQMADGAAQRWLPPSGIETYVRAGPLYERRTLEAVLALVLACAAATVIGLVTRDRRDFRETSVQARASGLQTSTSVLWFAATAAFAAWGLRALRDPSVAFWEWPGGWVLLASSCALVAALCSLLQVLMLPAVWRGGRRVDSWTAGRKLRFSLTALVFLGFSVLLAVWGALEPWSA